MPVVLIEKQTPQITVLTLNRPERRNGLTIELMTALAGPMATGPGAAVAGGAGIMTACDFVVAAERTKIGYPEVRRGLVAGLVMTFLRRQVGERNMRELLLGSEVIDAERAREIGLVNRVVANDALISEAMKFAQSALQGAPGALAQTKRLIEELWGRSVKEDVD